MNGIIKPIWEYNRTTGKNEIVGFQNLHNYGYIDCIDQEGTRTTINGCLARLIPKYQKMVKSKNYCYCVLYQARTINTPRYTNHDNVVMEYI